jgi:hypothetical protein
MQIIYVLPGPNLLGFLIAVFFCTALHWRTALPTKYPKSFQLYSGVDQLMFDSFCQFLKLWMDELDLGSSELSISPRFPPSRIFES